MAPENKKALLLSLWLGLTLGSMFFYPLTSSLHDSPYYMHWKPIHSLELLLAWVFVSAIFFSLMLFSLKKSGTRIGVAVVIIALAFPLISMLLHMARQLKLDTSLIKFANGYILYGILGGLALLIAVIVLADGFQNLRRKFQSALVIFLLVISPMNLTSVYAVFKSGHFLSRQAFRQNAERPKDEKNSAMPYGDIYIIVFDEMSYEYLYENKNVKGAFPNIKAFSSQADNYHLASAPGDSTESSMPGILMGLRKVKLKIKGDNIYISEENKELLPLKLDAENLPSTARAKGYKTALYGWYHDYCKMFGNVLDECRSFSLYNYSDVNERFSVLDPVRTTFILWPYVKPAGYFKVPVYSEFHKRNVEAIYRLAVSYLGKSEASFVFIHFPIPHIPFVYGPDGYNPPPDPYLPSEQNYIKQLKYVDRLFGDFIGKMKVTGKYEKSAVVLMSDHNFREKAERMQWTRIPLVVKRPKQTLRMDFGEPAYASAVLKNLIENN